MIQSAKSGRIGLALLAGLICCSSVVRAQQPGGAKPLSEADLIKLIELKIDDDAIIARLKARGLESPANDAGIARIKEAGASTAVIEAARAASPAVAKASVTYSDILDLLKLGLDEAAIQKRLALSPTRFTLSADQIAELKATGASDTLIAYLRGDRNAPAHGGTEPKITDFAIVLDCSGSMSEATPDGSSKMEEAQRVLADLIARLPESLRVTLVVYGHDRQQNCSAVKVARGLSELGTAGKSELLAAVGGARPAGNTPIAAALTMAGAELARADAPCGMVLLSDGKETCGGDTAGVAAGLAARLKLSFGIHVVGLGVSDAERASLEQVARAGKGAYHDARTAAELGAAFDGLSKAIEVVARPAETARTVKLNATRTLKILPTTVELPALEAFYLVPQGTDRLALRPTNVAKATAYGKELRIGAGGASQTFDLWFAPQKGRAIRMIAGLSVSEPTEIQPADHLGLVRVAGGGLPAASLVLLVPPGTEAFALRAEAAQSTDGYGHEMVVAPGRYDLWIEPADGGKSERLAQGIEVVAGKVTVVE